MRIAVIGTHCTGKTELVNYLHSFFRSRGKNVAVISEIARECPFPLNRKTTLEAQMWILKEHLRREREAKEKEIVISDRCLLDNYMYMMRAFPNEFKGFLQRVLESAKFYTHIFKTVPSSAEIENDGFRDTDPEFRMEIERMLKNFLDEHGVKYEEIPHGDYEYVLRRLKWNG